MGASPVLAQDGGGFSVSPPRLDVTITEKGRADVDVYLTSYFEGDILIGIEGLPYQVQPESIRVTHGDVNRKITVTLVNTAGTAPGEYDGKLTFLAYVGKNVAFGIKVDIAITQLAAGQADTKTTALETADKPGETADSVPAPGRSYIVYIIIGAVLAVALILTAFVLGVGIGRRQKQKTDRQIRTLDDMLKDNKE